MIEVAAVFLAAFLLDLAIGDPAYPLHPVRLLGRLAAFLERALRALGLSGFVGGGLFTLAHLAVTLAVWLGLGALAMAVHPRALDLLSVLAVYSSIAFRDLFDHAGPVRRALERGDLPAARSAVQRIVGRDAALLDAAGVARAAVESVAEGFVDGFFSPFVWYAAAGALALAGGLPAEQATLAATAAALLDRAVNTLDSMVGYRDERYRRFGWASARLDDLANFLPARLAVAALFVAALLLRLDAAAGLRVWLRDRRRHPSPNSGQAESYAAGALGVRLGGPTIYPHGMVTKGWLGDETVEVTGLHLDRCCRLVRTAGCLAAAAVLLMALTLPAAAAAATGPARRIVSLAPALTEDLFALGAGPAVVGDTEYCDYPAAARALPKVGGITS
ncbi:MAG TPA: adenosylcobinamide-phosphate synthase CbiB, partial [Thermoanaerobaculia bacterium]